MKNRRSILLKLTAVILVLVCAVFVFASPLNYTNRVYASSTSDSKVQSYEDRIAQLKQEQKDYEKKINEAKANAASFLEEKEYLDKQIAALSEQVEVSYALVVEYDNAIVAKQEAITAKEAELSNKFENFKERMRVSYEDGAMGYLAMLFSSESISDFLTSLERMTNMLDYDKRTMKEINDQKSALSIEKENLEGLRAAQQTVYDELKNTEADLITKAEVAANYYQAAIDDQAEFEKKYKEAQAAEKKATAELDAYLEELAKKNNGVYTGGAFSWPLPSSRNIITSKHGPRTYYIWGRWVSDNHRGIDIYCPTGTSVTACADGTVEIAGWNNSYGYYVVISHGSGYTTLYAHNSMLKVKQGQKVTRGQVISLSGSTGNSSGPHLHLEISINGKLQDPLANGILSHPSLVYNCD